MIENIVFEEEKEYTKEEIYQLIVGERSKEKVLKDTLYNKILNYFYFIALRREHMRGIYDMPASFVWGYIKKVKGSKYKYVEYLDM